MKLILASESFIRKSAMDMLELPYEVIPSGIDEKSVRENDPNTRALILAEKKATTVGKKIPDAIVVGSDAFLYREGKIFEKPESLNEASDMLHDLSGTEFQFLAALAVYHHQKHTMLSDIDTCRIKFRTLSTHEIEAYVSSHPVLKCAGAFDVEGALRFSEWVSGAPIMTTGMSLCRLTAFLKEISQT